MFSFADDDRVGVLPDLFGHQRRMWPANNDGNPSAAILSRQPVGVGRSRRVGRDADQIDWPVVIHVLHDFVSVGNFPVFGGISGKERHRQLPARRYPGRAVPGGDTPALNSCLGGVPCRFTEHR